MTCMHVHMHMYMYMHACTCTYMYDSGIAHASLVYPNHPWELVVLFNYLGMYFHQHCICVLMTDVD